MNLDPKKYNPDDVADPCGLMPKFYPQDNFLSVTSLGEDNLTMKDVYNVEVSQELADPYFIKTFVKNEENKYWTDINDPRFVNWMVI